MIFARVKTDEGIYYALVKDNHFFKVEGNIYTKYTATNEELTDFELLTPVMPTKILALGANYKKHAQELNLPINPVPMVFMKPTTSLLDPDKTIILPPDATKVDYEAELAIVIGKECRNINEEDVPSVVFGYTCANDVSERVFQKLDGQWTRAKGFDTFCPAGPYIVTDITPDNLDLAAIVNGEVRQKGNTSDMINGVNRTVSFISHIMTLKAGDIILTGTPDGIGPIVDGDTVEIRIEGIGSLINKVKQG